MTMASSSGGGGVPPGFRFHPTDEELLHYYLKKKVTFQKFEMEVIREVDLNKIEPWDLQERCRIGSTPQNEWYFFSHKDRKYPTGSRTNRATSAGFWKATGRDKCIRNSFKKIGMRKTLVFYRGRAPHGQKTDWIMHEYRLEDADDSQSTNSNEDGWVICRVFKKNNLFKAAGGEGTASVGMAADQLNNTPNANQSRTFADRDGQYLLRQQPAAANPHNFHLYKSSELALNYSPIPMPYAHINQPQNLLPVLHKPMPAYDYSSTTQLISSPRDCESGSVNHLRYEAGLEVGTCEPPHQTMVAAAAAAGRDHHGENMNEWGMLDRFVSSNIGGNNEDSSKGAVRFQDENGNTPSIHQMDQLSLRGEMDFWGYGK